MASPMIDAGSRRLYRASAVGAWGLLRFRQDGAITSLELCREESTIAPATKRGDDVAFMRKLNNGVDTPRRHRAPSRFVHADQSRAALVPGLPIDRLCVLKQLVAATRRKPGGSSAST